MSKPLPSAGLRFVRYGTIDSTPQKLNRWQRVRMITRRIWTALRFYWLCFRWDIQEGDL